MDFHPAVIAIEHVRAGDRHVLADGRNRYRILIAYARRNGIILRHRVGADRLEHQVAVLAGDVLVVDQVRVLGVEMQTQMDVAVWLEPARIDDAAHGDAVGDHV